MRSDVVVLTLVCVAGLGAAALAVVRWGGRDVSLPAMPPPGAGAAAVAAWWIRILAIVTTTAVLAGVAVAGLGGRLAMRVLAATAGPSAQGVLTEAQERVGEVTLGGTIGFVLFVGLGVGLVASAAFFLVHGLLPRRRAGGLMFGAALLILLATRIEPLRPDNPDFALVGPDFLSVGIFAALGLAAGLAIAAIGARMASAVPALGRHPRTWPAYLSLLVLIPTLLVGAALLIGAVVIAAHRLPAIRDWISSAAARTVLQVAGAALVLAALPTFVADIAAIL